MEIEPFPGIRAVPSVEPRDNGLDLRAISAVRGPSRSGDDTYSGKGKAATGGQDDEAELAEDEDEEIGEASLPEEEAPDAAPWSASGSPIDFFA